MVHYSKKDWWLVGAALAVVMIPLILGAFFLFPGTGLATGLLLIITAAVIGVVLLWFTCPLYYQITSSELFVRCGILMRKHIPLTAIDEVEPDRNPLGSPAWSLDRLRVNYRNNGEPAFIMTSPADKLAFKTELAGTDSRLKIKDDCLIRESEST